MRELIWQSAQLRLRRLALLAAGAAVITLGLSFLTGILQDSRQEMQRHVSDRWRTSFDILVRPANSSGPQGLLTPSQLWGGSGGITLQQWQQIKAIDGVDVAAPLAQAGWVDFPISVQATVEPGLYRFSWEQRQSNGLDTFRAAGTDYAWAVSPDLLSGTTALFEPTGIRPVPAEGMVPISLTATLPLAVVAIHPAEEARLLGVERSVTSGTYFQAGSERALPMRGPTGLSYSLPVLISSGIGSDLTLSVQAERLDLPPVPSATLLSDFAAKGGSASLAKLPGSPAFSWQSRPGRIDDLLLPTLGTQGFKPWWAVPMQVANQTVQYEPIRSLSPEQWPLAFKALPAARFPFGGATGTPLTAWRFANLADGPATDIRFHLVGTYDPSLVTLPEASDPAAALYRPGEAQFRFDTNGEPVTSGGILRPLSHPLDYLSAPPGIITDYSAIAPLLPDAAISTVRVRVSGVEAVSDDSILRVEKVAREIMARTGLQVDVMRGAAPQPVLVYLTGLGQNRARYITETWLKKGQTVEMVHELRRGNVAVMALVLLVGAVFVVASSMVHIMLRQQELATLAAVGWRTRHLLALILAESALVGASGGLAASLLLPSLRTLQAALAVLLLYLLGATLAALTLGIARPMRLLRGGGITPYKHLAHVENIRQVAWGSLWARRRNLLSLIALVLPTTLLVILAALTMRLEDQLFVTVLGQQMALDVGPLHYTMMAVAFVLAAATMADLMSLSVLERQGELALLSAIGWQRRTLRAAVLWEGLLWGLASGATGMGLGIGLLYLLYGRIQPGIWSLLPIIVSVPTLTGLVGALAPAESAARMEPAIGVKSI